MFEPRPLRDDDVEALVDLKYAAFADVDRSRGYRPPRDSDRVRIRRLLEADPVGCWVADDEHGALAGGALALAREGVWGLSLMVVRPDVQSRGLGTALLARALAYADGARGGIILASSDPRAARAYERAGFTRQPAIRATGTPRDVTRTPEVRAFTHADHAMAAAVDRAVRGAPHGADLDAYAAGGAALIAHPGRGYAVRTDRAVKLLAAADEDAAAALLRTLLAGGCTEVDWITPAQRWAIDVLEAAGLELEESGAVYLRGDVGSFRPYLPGGAYL